MPIAEIVFVMYVVYVEAYTRVNTLLSFIVSRAVLMYVLSVLALPLAASFIKYFLASVLLLSAVGLTVTGVSRVFRSVYKSLFAHCFQNYGLYSLTTFNFFVSACNLSPILVHVFVLSVHVLKMILWHCCCCFPFVMN